ncbi:MAG: 2-oxoglutarate dehydrogenase E1 component [Firmicutes bacterium]|nr:2-oxoglutarate dehydrogenase E1 component [Bacillota bacterium]
MANQQDGSSQWQRFYGANAGYVMGLYEQYLADPVSIDTNTRTFFEEQERAGALPPTFEQNSGEPAAPGIARETLEQIVRVIQFIEDLRREGHRAVAFDPFHPPERTSLFDLAARGIDQTATASLPSSILGPEYVSLGMTISAVLASLSQSYLGSMGIEFEHVLDRDERNWLRQQVESPSRSTTFSAADQLQLLQELVDAEEFEHFLHQTFPGQKRFSVEGLDVIVPVLNHLVRLAAAAEIDAAVIGMAHRGRLNVLAHVLKKPLETLLAEFLHHHSEPVMDDPHWTGDVKYHLGFSRQQSIAGRDINVILANNPSHLELVNPVVEGQTRALQDRRDVPGTPSPAFNHALAIIVHGDAAFDGEGVVAETLNLSKLSAYKTGGTVHIISNNDIGFTTDTEDERSMRYSSDLAKGYDIPIIHVSADMPETVIAAIDLAFSFRQRFHKDFLVDIVGYRRWGHNEGDEPAFTQPHLYHEIAAHPTVAVLYSQALSDAKILSEEKIRAIREASHARMTRAHQKASAESVAESFGDPVPKPAPKSALPLDSDQIRAWNRELLAVPEGFHLHPKLARVMARHLDGLDEEGTIDWAWAESLAFASILANNTPIRMTGQDTERGTFSQRHLVWHDTEGGPSIIPLAAISSNRASFQIHNSPLSEAAVLGFEYGYSVRAPETLVIWEAQFGDFANVAQPIIDQFIAAGRAKWRQSSGLVLLLPHGFEGQGPEHSSARLERYLQLAAEDNCYVANCTTAAQYFHLLRLHAFRLSSDPRPLIVMTPKSLLRHPLAGSSLTDLLAGPFQEILELPLANGPTEAVERVVLTSGKVAVDIKAEAGKRSEPELGVLRVLRLEQLYPFPEAAIRAYLTQFTNLREVIWLQEEPRNMGAWTFVQERLQNLLPHGMELGYIGRPGRASVASGSAEVHAEEQQAIIQQTLAVSTHRSKVRI